MRSWLLMFLLVLSVLIHDAQGRILISNKGSTPAEADHGLHEKLGEMNKSNHDEKESKKWSGSNRKLTLIHISSTTTIAKSGEIKGDLKSEALVSTNSKMGRGDQNVVVNSSSKTQQKQDIVDMAEMDYTLARRKPPIHN
ncbi:uncharacterized protein LOC121793996 isoform X2 [Salvia splendens]|uniref:uncharacterized protein LOC121793996 isoform X2 n=1 Tax=Salvia splendens TaxID=180675 RepID=UPI001C267384|nr:uncharacterized protein LOC121793996 isoform X2 [Salvia splendens]